MKTQNRSFVNIVRLLLVIGFLGTICFPLQTASAGPSAEDFIVNPAAEQYVLNELLTSGSADLAIAFPDEKQRVISADFFISVLNNPDIQSRQNVNISNATIAGYVYALSSNIPYTLILNAVVFTDSVIFSNSNFASVAIIASTFYQGVEFQNVNADDLDLRNGIFYHGLNLYGAQIGELTLTDSQILGTEPMRDGIPFPSEFRRMNVANMADLNGTYFEGVAMFEESEFHRLQMWGTQFAGDANFSKVLIDRSGEFVGTQFLKNANFDQTNFGDVSFEEAAFVGAATFKNASVKGNLNFNKATFGLIDSIVDLSEIEVTDTTSLNDISAAAGLDLSYSSFKDLKISARDAGVIASLDLTQAVISGQFVIKSSQINNLKVTGLKNGGTAALDHVTITDSLDLQNARLNLLVVNELKWPESPQAFNLRGMTFSDIDLGERGLTEETWHELLRLVDTSVYSPQSYKAISQFFRDKGYPDWASEMELAGKRRERDEILKPFSGAWLWSWFLDIFSGYGFRPYLAFIWSALVVLLGAFAYRRREDMIPVNQAEAKVEYNALWYSFALFLPYIDLGIQGKWEPSPERKWARYYKYVHMLLGWVLMPIALLAFGGVLR